MLEKMGRALDVGLGVHVAQNQFSLLRPARIGIAPLQSYGAIWKVVLCFSFYDSLFAKRGAVQLSMETEAFSYLSCRTILRDTIHTLCASAALYQSAACSLLAG